MVNTPIPGAIRSTTKNCLGGISNILIQESDGKVLAVWHNK